MWRQDKSTVKLPDYSEVSALLSWAPRVESEAHNLIARHKPPSRSLQKLLVWASIGVLLFSSIGCSRDVQHAEDTGKKIDLTLPELQVRVQPVKKPPDKVDASTEEKAVKKKVESASATAQHGVTQPITRQPEVAPVNGGHVKKQARRTPAKKRDSAAITRSGSLRPQCAGIGSAMASTRSSKIPARARGRSSTKTAAIPCTPATGKNDVPLE